MNVYGSCRSGGRPKKVTVLDEPGGGGACVRGGGLRLVYMLTIYGSKGAELTQG